MVKVRFNGADRDVPEGTTVGQLVDREAPSRRGTAVALNGGVVPTGEWDRTRLVADDHVEVLHARQGG